MFPPPLQTLWYRSSFIVAMRCIATDRRCRGWHHRLRFADVDRH